ncbi:MAG: hypothetical protein FJ135_18005 [Deltaproteobacteria bacterium]|nr:hypothetical protein [Deltaproteobacteria bacterium]
MLRKPLCLVIALTITLVIALGSVSTPRPASASSGDTLLVTAVPAASVVGTAVAGYLLYKNRYAQPADARGRLGYRGPGEFFIGGFLGAAFVPDTHWTYKARGINSAARSMQIDPGVTGGIKVGYFFDSIPVLGIQGEGSIGNHPQPAQSVRLNPPIAGATRGRVNSQTLLAWTMAFHILGRYGFLPDQEVPFGRLQPYVGIGPGLVMLYADADSAKNFSLEVLGGLRYMFTKNLGGFLEYKFSKQWDVELESQQLFYGNTGITAQKATFDFDRHQVVVGLAYHF